VRQRRCLEDEAEAGSAEALAGAAIPTPSADGFHGCQDGGGHTPPTGFPIIELFGFHHIHNTPIHGMATEHTGNTNKR